MTDQLPDGDPIPEQPKTDPILEDEVPSDLPAEGD
jgi:hypothetical protein